MYVGASVNAHRRMGKHKQMLKNGKHSNYLLQEDWNKYGKENFQFSIAEVCLEEQLEERELYWMNIYKSLEQSTGYNILTPAGVPIREAGYNKGKEVRENTGPRYRKGKDIVAISTTTGETTEFKSPLMASRALNIKPTWITDVLTYWSSKGSKLYSKRSRKGYIFVRKSEYDPNFDYLSFRLSNHVRREVRFSGK